MTLPDRADAAQLGRFIPAGAASGNSYGQSALGGMNVIKPAEGYAMLAGMLGNDEDIGTRLGEKQAVVRLARRDGGRLVPWAEHAGADMPLRWALSELSIARRLLGKDASVAESAEIQAVKASWPEFEQNILLAEVDGDGRLLSLPGGLTYGSGVGLTRPARSEPMPAFAD